MFAFPNELKNFAIKMKLWFKPVDKCIRKTTNLGKNVKRCEPEQAGEDK